MAEWRRSYLWHGLPGHPIHPPLTDVTIGAYSFASIAAVLSKAGVADHPFAKAWWLALVVGLASSALTVLSGVIEWLQITWGSELWKTVVTHALTMVTATVFFVVAIVFGHHGYTRGAVTTGSFVLTLAGFVALTAGGWLGGAITYVHGMRVLSLTDEAAVRAAAPCPTKRRSRPRPSQGRPCRGASSTRAGSDALAVRLHADRLKVEEIETPSPEPGRGARARACGGDHT